jgi:hypothetical protein
VIDRLAWKVCDFPTDVQTILAIGCGAGLELAFLRACAPTAKVEFRKADVFEFLEQTPERFDVV